MTSNRSFFKMLRETMRRNVWATALSLVGFFFCLPLPAAMIIQNQLAHANEEWTTYEQQLKYAARDVHMLLSTENPFVKIGMCIMAVLCGVAMFAYLHSRKQVDFYHSIPVKRGELFLNNYCAGAAMTLVPFFIMYALTGIIGAVMGVHGAVSGKEILFTLVMHVLFFLFIYTISVLATVLAGNTILAVLLDAWMLFSIPGAALIATAMGEMYFEHWNGGGVIEWVMYHTSPIVLYFATGSSDFNFWGTHCYETASDAMPMLAVVLLVTLVFAALGYVLFCRRKSERAGTAIAFNGFKAPLKCYMVLMIALVFGLIFDAIGGSFWIWFGLLAGTALGHVIIEMIYNFDFRAAFSHWKTMIVLAVAAAAIVLGVQTDVFGYDNWLPKTEKVAAATFRTGLGNNENRERSGLWERMRRNAGGVSDENSIAAIRRLAEIGIESQDRDGMVGNGVDSEFTYLNVDFMMKNGILESRRYSIPNNDEVWALVDSIRFTEEYQTKVNPLFQRDFDAPDTVMTMSVRNHAESSDQPGKKITDPAKTRKIMETLRMETLTLTPEIAKTTVPVLRMDISLRYTDEERYGEYYGGTEYIPIYPTFTRTMALLAAEGIVPRELTADDLEDVMIYWNADNKEPTTAYEYEDGMVMAATTETASGENYVKITDKAEMQKVLENAMLEPVACSCDAEMALRSNCEGGYWIAVHFTDGGSTSLHYPADRLPVELCKAYRTQAEKPAE